MSTTFHSNRVLTQKPLRGRLIYLIILFALGTSACSLGKPPPTEALSKAELDLRAASEARADELAPMDLQGARGKTRGIQEGYGGQEV
jgi:hypothetical protein